MTSGIFLPEREVFVSFRFIQPSSDNLRLIIQLQITIFILKFSMKLKVEE